MKLLENLRILFSNPLFALFPELTVYDTILEKRIDIIKIFEGDLVKDLKKNNLGRKDTPSVEQIVRAIIYKEVRGLTYEELEKHQFDSEICKHFLKLGKKAYSDSMFQHYVQKIQPITIKKMFVEINNIAIEMGYEDVKDIRIDSTVIKTDTHHPTNNSLVYDCIKSSTDLLSKLIEKKSEEYNKLINRLVEVKKIYYKLNNIKIDEVKDKEEKKKKRAELMKNLFAENLNFLTSIHFEIKDVIKNELNTLSIKNQVRIKDLDRQIEIIYKNAYRFQIEGKKVKNSDKIFSIYEEHTDLIVKGLREWLFGHKVNITSGKSNLILDCEVLKGNPADVNLFEEPLKKIHENYGKQIESFAGDGGYASLKNQEVAKGLNIKNIVFTKIVGSLQNIVECEVKEKMLNNFRAGAEAVISNLKRGFDLQRVNWKGFKMFEAKVFWGVVGYNIRVLTGHILNSLYSKMVKA